jgi:hypothetical protein
MTRRSALGTASLLAIATVTIQALGPGAASAQSVQTAPPAQTAGAPTAGLQAAGGQAAGAQAVGASPAPSAAQSAASEAAVEAAD